ncbi:MAG: L,D-transpeptidase [Chitinophagaceae bacterium]|nr:L,D-transpeptidase [Chitinophagaceae bacterium]
MKKTNLYSVVFVVSLFAVMSFMLPDKKKNNIRSAKKSLVERKSKRLLAEENPYYIIVDKSEYELKVYDDDGWYATYPIVFGSKDLGDKMREGDKKTPNGKFKVILKKIHDKWGPELLLDYPNPENVQKFIERKQKGIIPKTARIGSGIAIHATRPEEEWTIDNFYNWTDGCVSVKYTEMKDLFSYIPVGTPVTIQP